MTTAIELRGVEKSFGITSVIRNVNLTVAQGERHALIGPNGAGKSTLFNLISGYMMPTAGSILLRDEVISGLPPFQINRRGLSRSFQVTNVFANMSVWENLRCAVLWAAGHRYALVLTRSSDAAEDLVQEALTQPFQVRTPGIRRSQ